MSAHESAVVRAIRGFRRQLIAHDAQQGELMASCYLDIEHALADKIAALSEQVVRMRAEGAELNWNDIYHLERYQRLQIQLGEELRRFNGWSLDLITKQQVAAAVKGIADATAALNLVQPGLGGMVVRMPHEAIQALVGVAKNGAPLGDLLAKSYPAARDAISRELIRSVALGRSPFATAQAVAKATNVGLDNALTMARTEQMRAYRSASQESYQSVGVQYWERVCANDVNSCFGCLAADGEVLPISEPLDDHVNGMCGAAPIVPGVENPVTQSSQDWFGGLDPATQQSMMGPTRYEAWKSGAVSWQDLGTHTHDPVWGNAPAATPVGQLSKAAA